MFLYYDLKQAEKVIQFVQGQRRRAPYKGPDFFVVLGGVDGTKDRKRWVVWHEGGRYPDVIIEITSPSTKSKDTEDNLLLYSKVFRTREYYWYDEASGELAGYRLQGDEYVPIVPSERGWLWSEVLGVWLGVSDAPFLGWRYRWLRFYREDGSLVPTGEERKPATRQAEANAPSRNACCASKPSDASPNWKRNLGDCAVSRRTSSRACASEGYTLSPEVRRCTSKQSCPKTRPRRLDPTRKPCAWATGCSCRGRSL
jgi:hypothetical protein